MSCCPTVIAMSLASFQSTVYDLQRIPGVDTMDASARAHARPARRSVEQPINAELYGIIDCHARVRVLPMAEEMRVGNRQRLPIIRRECMVGVEETKLRGVHGWGDAAARSWMTQASTRTRSACSASCGAIRL